MVAAILVHGLLLVAFGVGISRLATRKRLRWVGLSLMVAGVIGLPTHTVFAMSSRWMTEGFNDTMHASVSLAFGLVAFVAVALSAVVYRGARLYAIATIGVLVEFGATSSFAIQGIEQNFTPRAGAFERITAYSYVAWLIVLGLTLRRSLDQEDRPERERTLVMRPQETTYRPEEAKIANCTSDHAVASATPPGADGQSARSGHGFAPRAFTRTVRSGPDQLPLVVHP